MLFWTAFACTLFRPWIRLRRSVFYALVLRFFLLNVYWVYYCCRFFGKSSRNSLFFWMAEWIKILQTVRLLFFFDEGKEIKQLVVFFFMDSILLIGRNFLKLIMDICFVRKDFQGHFLLPPHNIVPLNIGKPFGWFYCGETVYSFRNFTFDKPLHKWPISRRNLFVKEERLVIVVGWNPHHHFVQKSP